MTLSTIMVVEMTIMTDKNVFMKTWGPLVCTVLGITGESTKEIEDMDPC